MGQTNPHRNHADFTFINEINNIVALMGPCKVVIPLVRKRNMAGSLSPHQIMLTLRTSLPEAQRSDFLRRWTQFTNSSDQFAFIPIWGKTQLVNAALVDADDAPLVTPYRWNLHTSFYAIRSIPRTTVRMHRQILGLPAGCPDKEVDHRNGDGLDNRRANMRIVTHAQNLQNKRSAQGSSSSYRGVSWHAQSCSWQASVKVNGQTEFKRYFKTETDAAIATSHARMQLLPFTVEERFA